MSYKTRIHVDVYNNQWEAALKVFSRKVKEEKLILQIKEAGYYEKPSVGKRRAKSLAKIRERNRTREQKKQEKYQ